MVSYLCFTCVGVALKSIIFCQSIFMLLLSLSSLYLICVSLVIITVILYLVSTLLTCLDMQINIFKINLFGNQVVTFRMILNLIKSLAIQTK